MSLVCTLGLVACLNYHGTEIPAQDAFQVLDTCGLVIDSQRMDDKWVLAAVSSIEKLTHNRIVWPSRAYPHIKRLAVVMECGRFQTAFDNKSAWENLDKWPD